MKLYLTLDETLMDGRITDLLDELGTGQQAIAIKLLERSVQLANSHIWGTMIMMVQDSESQPSGEQSSFDEPMSQILDLDTWDES